MAARAVALESVQLENVSSESAVSWPAVFAGAAVAAALSVILIALGAGLGLSAISPWSNVGASASTIGTFGIGWLIISQVLASAMGGYLAGRLRTNWVSVHNDEIYFRDTAHGFLVWAVGVIITASLLGSAALSMSGASAADNRVSGERNNGADYFVDNLLRSEHAGSPADSQTTTEIGTILMHGLKEGEVSRSDRAFLASLVSARTDLTPTDAQNRVNSVISDMRQAADKARKATAHFLLWSFLALLIGAFCASFSATLGGKQRDGVKKATV